MVTLPREAEEQKESVKERNSFRLCMDDATGPFYPPLDQTILMNI